MTTLPDYPSIGAPCNGCGLCCAASACGLAREFLGASGGPCPALEYEDGRFWCGLLRAPHRFLGSFPEADHFFQPVFAYMLGAGLGCDSDGPNIAAYRAREAALSRSPA